MQAFRQEGEYGHYLRVNPDYRRWEIAENLRPSIFRLCHFLTPLTVKLAFEIPKLK